MATIVAFLHHLGAFALFAALAVQLILVHQELTLANARRLLAADRVLGLAAGLVLVAGLLRVGWFEKGADYYFSSFAFITKFAVFLAVAVLSLMPTLNFLSWRKELKAGRLPAVEEKRWRMIQATIHGEVAAVIVILFCAAVMAKGGIV